MPGGKARSADDNEAEWRVCLECGNRFEVGRKDSTARWCSYACQTTTYRTGREEIEMWAPKVRWWLR